MCRLGVQIRLGVFFFFMIFWIYIAVWWRFGIRNTSTELFSSLQLL